MGECSDPSCVQHVRVDALLLLTFTVAGVQGQFVADIRVGGSGD